MNKQQIKYLFIFFLYTFISIFASSCSPVYTQHGHLIDNSGYKILIENRDNKKTVINKLGSPSSKNPLNENTWIYITSIHEKKPFKSSKKIEQQVLAVTFNENDILINKRVLTLKDGKVLTPLEEKTVTYGKKTSLFREIFGNLGKYRPSPQ
ncbi:MAG: hypothetical protein CFH01_01599 [Alphaproteobacteria bacterium MarineAlpha2_Bin1]|nr:MAG: hypothetical protein CFH01_01599 [Alphaproteobacteria bacterium MarineAlpha2_Bin1]|tara:strand:+ start:485 stop:940 length:456 start_codon:yes stop_codon:yes gene_type:complete